MIVLVAGMHRSGTSALAGMLHSNGIIMGHDGKWHPPPMRENPKGFFENRDFRVLNDQILRDHGYRVKSFDPVVPTIEVDRVRFETKAQAQLLVQEYNRAHEHWGFKDPRTCLTMPVWLRVIDSVGISSDDVRILLTCRATDDVVESMKRRGNKERLGPGQFRDLAMAYNRAVLDACDGWVKYKTVDYADLMYKTKATALAIGAFVGCSIDDTEHITPELADRAKRGRHG
jgi:hypothetical protein